MPTAAVDLEELPAEQAGVYRPGAGTEHRDRRGQYRQQDVKPLVVHLRKVWRERDPQLVDGNRHPGNRRPQTEEEKDSASRCDKPWGNIQRLIDRSGRAYDAEIKEWSGGANTQQQKAKPGPAIRKS
jgi:hypothetical protein